MREHVVLLSIPALRSQDLAWMPRVQEFMGEGSAAPLVPTFPAVTCPVQVNMTTGELPHFHGVVGNGFYWRERAEVEMWTAWGDVVQKPRLWDLLHASSKDIRTAAWFGLLTKGCGADYVCTPAPVHNPDGSESLWCYTKPTELYGELRDQLGHFPLQHFWGPLADRTSSEWIADSAVIAAAKFQPHFFYIYLPHLDYASQKYGPDSTEALHALTELDDILARMLEGLCRELGGAEAPPLVLAASEYTVVPVRRVAYPNRVLRSAGLVAVRSEEGTAREILDLRASRAWALVDHQFSHVFVQNHDSATIRQVANLFANCDGIAEVLVGEGLARYGLQHERSGDVVLVSAPDSWQAYYYWFDDALAPSFARTVDIHRKPGYDPVELFFDPAAKGIPLRAELVRGSHGAPAASESQRGVILASQKGVLLGGPVADTDVADIVLRQFGV